MRVLLVEDDDRIGSFIDKGLEEEGHVVDWARTGDEGLDRLLEQEYDAAVVDVMLPGTNGLDVIGQARRKRVATPIIVLSARGGVDDRVAGLDAGADDYLPKPFAFAELTARLHALIRRSAGATGDPTRLAYAGVTADLRTRRVERDGTRIDLQAKEFVLLEYFLRNPDRVLTKTMILQQVWDYAFDPQTNVVDVLVCRLRAKIDRGFEPKLIHTLRGVGYVLRGT